MPKPDPTVDYYGILSVPQNADEEEIKKAWKKLALKWHPDRNHGNEGEAATKFQDIGAAYDILTDPALRAKYDTNRAKAKATFDNFPSPTNRRPNMAPRQSAYTGFPPRQPPRPGPQASPRNFMKSPPSGAERYARYTADPNAWANKNESPKRASAAFDYRAWDQMKPGASHGRAPPEPSPNNARNRPMRSAGDGPAGMTPKQRAGWDTRPAQDGPQSAGGPGMSRANTTRAPKKAGWAPGMQGGDEPAARNTSAYYSVNRGEVPQAARPQAYPPPPPPQGPAPTAQKSAPPRPNHLRTFRSPGSDERLRMPYATSGGEKTYLQSEGLRRTPNSGGNLHAGWQEARASRENVRSPPDHDRHCSASPRIRSPSANTRPSSPSSSDSSDSEVRVKLKPKGFRARRQNGNMRPAQSTDHHNGDATFASVKERGRATASHDDLNKVRSANDAYGAPRRTSAGEIPAGFRQHRMSREVERDYASPSNIFTAAARGESMPQPVEKSKAWQGNCARHFDPPPAGESADGQSQYDSTLSLSVFPRFLPSRSSAAPPLENITRTIEPEKGLSFWRRAYRSLSPPKPPSSSTFSFTPDPSARRVLYSIQENANHPFTFSSVNPNPTDTTSPTKTTSDRTTTGLSNSEWQQKLNSNTAEYLAPQKSGPQSRGRASPTTERPKSYAGSRSPQWRATNGVRSPETAMPPPPSTTLGSPPKPPPLNKFSKDDWNDHFKEPSWAYPQPSQSPVRPDARRQKQTNGVRRATMPKPAAVSSVSANGEEGTHPRSSTNGVDSNRSSSSAMDLDNTPPAKSAHNVPPPPPPPPQQSRPDAAAPGSRPPTSGSHAPKSADVDAHPHFNLTDLKRTAPFAPSKSGLADLRDLHSDLPFESAPGAPPSSSSASQHSAAAGMGLGPVHSHAQKLTLPAPPRAPPAPARRDRLSKQDWEVYGGAMRPYLAEWNAFNKRMLAHFNAREARVETELPDAWVLARGEDGFRKYVAGLEEDVRVRAHWDACWQGHIDAMRTYGEVRRMAAMGRFFG